MHNLQIQTNDRALLKNMLICGTIYYVINFVRFKKNDAKQIFYITIIFNEK